MCGNWYSFSGSLMIDVHQSVHEVIHLRNPNRAGAFWLLVACVILLVCLAFGAGPFKESPAVLPAASGPADSRDAGVTSSAETDAVSSPEPDAVNSTPAAVPEPGTESSADSIYIPAIPEPPLLSVSARNGFYTEELLVRLSASEKSSEDIHIYYTLNGDDPTPDSLEYGASGAPVSGERTDADSFESVSETITGTDSEVSLFEEPSDIDSGISSAEEIPDTVSGVSESKTIPDSAESPAAYRDPVPSASESPVTETDEGLLFPLDGPSKVYTLKAALYEGDICLERIDRTYVLGEDIFSYYDLDVICVTSDSDNLYDYDTGIMVYGAEYEREKRNGENGTLMGNMGEDWTRDAHVTMFSADGSCLFDDDCGLSLSGGTSRLMDTKSLMLTAGRGADPSDNRFRISLYGEETFSENSPPESECSFVSEYKRLRLRSGAQDLVDTKIRSSVVSRLCEEASFFGCSPTRRVIVFLNGEFYSIADMQASYTDTFLGDRFSLPNDQLVEKEKGSEESVLNSFGIRDLFRADLNRSENREALEKRVDMDDYLRYYAVQILTGNTDWPDNNYEAWRYLGMEVPGNQYTDGRLRFLIFDTDLTWYRKGRIDFFEGATEDTFVSIMESTHRAAGSVFSHVMESAEYRNRFLVILSSLMNGPFKKGRVLTIIDEEAARIRKAEQTFRTEDQAAAWEEYITVFRSAAEEWSDIVREDLFTYFGVEDRVTWRLMPEDGVVIKTLFGTALSGEDLQQVLCRGVSVTLEAESCPGYEFTGWEVNGSTYEDEILTLTPEMIGENVRFVRVTAHAQPLGGHFVRIDRVSRRGTDDWFEIVNCGQQEELLANYCVSDDPDHLFKGRLPSVHLAPGETIRIYCSKSRPGIGAYVCNFSLSEGESLYLTDNVDGTTQDVLALPMMQEGESYGRYGHSCIFRFRKEE